ncbi:helix-turn-helix domain-containing protein [Mycolicibacterium llatzerense]|uniref:helix-turn-helix domain-containing protein n=1 Tax=Mycolicibacterium llatzerense TaxID=280871 RepID=UPI001F3452D5|nr:hypothetical protein [Mycolicibacterium llatzerense]
MKNGPSKEIARRQEEMSAVEIGWANAALASCRKSIDRTLRRGRPINLPPGLTSPAQVRAELLAAVAHRSIDDRTEAERQETSAWRQRIQDSDDDELWTDYAAPLYFAGPKLGIIRRVAGLTQVELAKNMGSTQAVISRLEGQSDLLLSTFAGYLHAAGAKARVVITIGDRDIELDLDEIRKAVPRKTEAR